MTNLMKRTFDGTDDTRQRHRYEERRSQSQPGTEDNNSEYSEDLESQRLTPKNPLRVLKGVSHLDQLKGFANNYSEAETHLQESGQEAEERQFLLMLYGSAKQPLGYRLRDNLTTDQKVWGKRSVKFARGSTL